MTKEEVEAVARAFYENQEYARGWDLEPEALKETFRGYARVAIAALDGPISEPPLRIKPLVISTPLQASRGYFMEAEGIGALPASSFKAVLRGPALIYDAVDAGHSKFVGHRNVLNMPVREALPELTGQGYFEILDQSFATGKPFIGERLPMRIQQKPNGPLEERIIDVVYRPIRNPAGDILGLFAEGRDRTQKVRA